MPKALHVRMADEAVHLPGVSLRRRPTSTWRRSSRRPRSTGAEAIHPGYGFLAENADFAEAVIASGLVWIGPPPEATRAVGDKIRARRIAIEAGVPVVPGITEADRGRIASSRRSRRSTAIRWRSRRRVAEGAAGLKVARSADELADAFESARREAEAYFGSRDVYVERYLENPKHLEVQLLAPSPDRGDVAGRARLLAAASPSEADRGDPAAAVRRQAAGDGRGRRRAWRRRAGTWGPGRSRCWSTRTASSTSSR